MSLTRFHTQLKELALMMTSWSSQLDPVIACPLVSGILLSNIPLTTGANVINHKLGRKLIGWYIVRQDAVSSIFDTQDTNSMPNLTLQLTSSATCVVSLWVF